MFRLGIIEESLIDKSILDDLKQYYISQRLQRVPDDKFPIWHINEYHMDISQIKKTMIDCGALGAIMSGSGSTVFGIFPDTASASGAYKNLHRVYKDTFLTKSI